MKNNTVITETVSAARSERSSDSSPFMNEFFMVQGVGFRCMAYKDESGRWRSAFNHVELVGDIRILE